MTPTLHWKQLTEHERALRRAETEQRIWGIILAAGILLMWLTNVLTAHGAESTSVPLLTQNVKIGTVITADMLAVKGIPSKGLPTTTLTNVNDIIGKTAMRNLKAGAVIVAGYVQTPPAIAKNDIITARFTSGDLVLETPARALENGSVGQTIKIMNMESNKQLPARVVGGNAVEVEGTL